MVVYFAGTPWDGNTGTDQKMASRLTRFAPLLYVDPPLSLVSRYRNPAVARALDGPRLRMVAPRLARLTPVVLPGMSHAVLRSVAKRTTTVITRRAIRSLQGAADTVVIATLNSGSSGLGERQTVFYATDDFAAGGRLMGQSTGWLTRQQQRLVARSDRVIAISASLADQLGSTRPDVKLVANGVDEMAFASVDSIDWPVDVTLPEPIAGFMGHLSERIDIEYLEAVAARGVSLLLVGPRQPTFDMVRLDRLLGRANVQWVGGKTFPELPAYARAMKVGLLPYGDTDFNRASFPLKLLEYLAAGRAAVATDLPAVRWLRTSLVDVASTPADFADLVQAKLDEPVDEQAAKARRLLAAEHSWDVRAAEFASFLGLPRVR